MQNNSEFRRFLLKPIPEIYVVAKNLELAVKYHNQNNEKIAKQLIEKSNLPVLSDWYETIVGKYNDKIHRLQKIDKQETIKTTLKRMPSSIIKKQLIERDGYNCRYCGIPVIRAEVRDRIRKKYPDVLNWKRKNIERHSAFLCLWLTYEHIVPHSKGGDNSLNNMIISCQACNCAKSNNLLEEMGLFDPRKFKIQKTNWIGLEDFK